MLVIINSCNLINNQQNKISNSLLFHMHVPKYQYYLIQLFCFGKVFSRPTYLCTLLRQYLKWLEMGCSKPTGSPITDPGKVDTYYKCNGWKNFKTQTIIQFHIKVHFVYFMKNDLIFEGHAYFQDQSQVGFFNYFYQFLSNIMYKTCKNKHI